MNVYARGPFDIRQTCGGFIVRRVAVTPLERRVSTCRALGLRRDVASVYGSRHRLGGRSPFDGPQPMPDWRNYIERCYALAGPGWRLVMPAGTEAAQVDEAAASLGVALPAEFRGLYGAANGFGGVGEAGPVEWAALPLDALPPFAETVRRWFGASHPRLATRFVPLLDWRTGTATGYLFDERGETTGRLTTFFHEQYRPDAAGTEFLVTREESIEEFLANWDYLQR